MARLLKELGIDMKPSEIRVLIDAFDANGDGSITAQEFNEFVGPKRDKKGGAGALNHFSFMIPDFALLCYTEKCLYSLYPPLINSILSFSFRPFQSCVQYYLPIFLKKVALYLRFPSQERRYRSAAAGTPHASILAWRTPTQCPP